MFKLKSRLAQLRRFLAEATEPEVIAGIMEAIKDVNESLAHYAAQHPAS